MLPASVYSLHHLAEEMTTQSKIIWLRVSYWSGAIADGMIAIRTMIPEIMGETEFRYAMGIATTLIIGWTSLVSG